MLKVDAKYIETLVADYNDSLHTYIKKYVPNKSVSPITEDVYLVEFSDKIYIKLKNDNARAWCDPKTGIICIRNDVNLTAHLLIHEFIHRLSRNKIRTGIIPKWILGVGIYIKPYNYNGINEVFTEWITSNITKIKEIRNPYYSCFCVIDILTKTPACNFQKMLEYYFSSNVNDFNRELRNVFYPQLDNSDVIFKINQTINNISKKVYSDILL